VPGIQRLIRRAKIMKRKMVKKIAHTYLARRWYSGEHEELVCGEWWIVANLPTAVAEYLRRETVRRGLCWRDNPALLEQSL
jgi:hypothetical protein